MRKRSISRSKPSDGRRPANAATQGAIPAFWTEVHPRDVKKGTPPLPVTNHQRDGRVYQMAGSSKRKQRRQGSEPSPVANQQADRSRMSTAETTCWAILLALAVLLLIFKQHSQMFLAWTDEQIHFYVAKRMSEGAVLYRDIDSARPPLILLPLSCLIRLGCTPLLAGRVLVVGAQLATAALLLWSGTRLASGRGGALAALLFLTSPEIYDRIHYTGIQSVSFTASACLIVSLCGRPLIAGVFCGLTLATGQHGLVFCAVAGVTMLVWRRRGGGQFAAATLGTAAVVFGGVWVLGGRHLWQDLVGD